MRYLHTSPYKVRQVLTLVRGLPVDDAERLLQLCEKDAADDVLKLLGSAIANAEHNNSLPADELFVALAWADEGPTRKHGQPRARGRYFRIRKRTSHVTIVLERFALDELEDAPPARRGDRSRRRGRAAPARRARAALARDRSPKPTKHDAEVEEPEVDEIAADEVDGREADDARRRRRRPRPTRSPRPKPTPNEPEAEKD